MPELARFDGIIISMRQRGKEHPVPHVHAWYSGYEARFEIRTGKKMDNNFPNTQTKAVAKWVIENKEMLIDLWEAGEIKQ